MKKFNRFIAAIIAVLTVTTAVCAAVPLSAATNDMTAMTFKSYIDTGALETDTKYGNATPNYDDETIDIAYAAETQWTDVHYMAKPKFRSNWFIKNPLVSTHKYVRVLYSAEMPEGVSCNLRLENDTDGKYVTLSNNVTDTDGKYVLTGVQFLGNDVESIFNRFMANSHNSLIFDTTDANCFFKVKAIYFYANEEDAYAVQHSAMTFEHGGTGDVHYKGANYGNIERDYNNSAVNIAYADNTNMSPYHYMAKLYFANKSDMNSAHKYVRVLYAADMPNGETATMSIVPDGNEDSGIVFANPIKNTNGAWVLSDTVELSAGTLSRYSNAGWNSLLFDSVNTDCTFKIKALYFFETTEDASAFSYLNGNTNVTINGNDISLYQIVIADDAPLQVQFMASNLSSYIKDLTGERVPVVTDKADQTAYEILIGKSTRANSYEGVLEPISADDITLAESTECNEYAIKTINNTLVLTTHLPHNITDCVNNFLVNYLHKGYYSGIPAQIELSGIDKTDIATSDPLTYVHNIWNTPENVGNPEVLTFDFGSDDGYFMEENNVSDFEIANGVLTADADDLALTYLHLYETNAIFAADFTYENAGENGDLGIMLRYNEANAWVKAGFDFETNEWYIDSRDGKDFYRFRLDSQTATLTAGETYRLELTVDASSATLSVNGTPVAETDNLTHLSPGRAAIYAEDVEITVDNAELTLLSGQGEIMKNVTHNVLPTGSYVEGGTVIERANNTIASYYHGYGFYYDSTDDGKTWVEGSKWFEGTNHGDSIRLNNGDILNIVVKNGYHMSQTSSDDGKTWTDGGIICTTYYIDKDGKEYPTFVAGNVNDKIFQSGTNDYIYYCQSYEAPNTGTGLNGHRIFSDVFLSKDGGANWELIGNTLNMELNGEDTGIFFGECKVLELEDGTIRLYNSYNEYGCIVYSDFDPATGKFDNELAVLTDVNGEIFPCSTSSMQFARDRYASNPHTYYMIWVDNFDHTTVDYTRCGLTLAYSEDGATWTKLGTLWRWESTYRRNAQAINHAVDPFIQITNNAIICGSGLADGILENDDGGECYHNGQRQHIYSLPKTFAAGDNFSDTLTSVDYAALANGTHIVKIDAAEGNTMSYSYTLNDGTVVPFYYSNKYEAYVAVLPVSVSAGDVYNNVEADESTPAEELAYDGDINGDGKITAGDAALVSAMINAPGKTDNEGNPVYTAKMRLEADYFESDDFVTLDDCLALLYAAVGLTYTPAN